MVHPAYSRLACAYMAYTFGNVMVMAYKGTSGGSLGGGIVHTRKRPQRQLNSSPCPMCGAGKGQTCQDNRPGMNLRPMSKTHASSNQTATK